MFKVEKNRKKSILVGVNKSYCAVIGTELPIHILLFCAALYLQSDDPTLYRVTSTLCASAPLVFDDNTSTLKFYKEEK